MIIFLLFSFSILLLGIISIIGIYDIYRFYHYTGSYYKLFVVIAVSILTIGMIVHMVCYYNNVIAFF